MCAQFQFYWMPMVCGHSPCFVASPPGFRGLCPPVLCTFIVKIAFFLAVIASWVTRRNSDCDNVVTAKRDEVHGTSRSVIFSVFNLSLRYIKFTRALYPDECDRITSPEGIL